MVAPSKLFIGLIAGGESLNFAAGFECFGG